MGADPDPGIEPVAAGERDVAAGTPRPGAADIPPRGHAFISYVREDADEVGILQRMLEAAGVPVWRDTDSLWPGVDWRAKIREAITHDALVFIACFSRHSAARRKTYQYAELRLAIRELESRPPKIPWLIPVRFDDCELPPFDWGSDESLERLPRADLFGEHATEDRAWLVSTARTLLGADAGADPPAGPGIAPGPLGAGRWLTRRNLLVAAGVLAVGTPALVLADRVLARSGAGPGETPSGRPGRSGSAPASNTSAATQSPGAGTTALGPTAAPVGHPLTGNGGTVYSVAFSPDGHTLASGSADWHTRLWNVTDPSHPAVLGKPLAGHDEIVYSVAFSPKRRILASGSADATVALWNVTDLDRPAPLSVGFQQAIGALGTIYSVAFSPHGNTLAVGSDTDNPQDPSSPYLALWNVADPAHPTDLSAPSGHKAAVFSVAFSPDGRILASGSADETIRLWDVANLAHPVPLGQPLAGYTSYIYSVAFSPDGRILAGGNADRTIQLWNVTDVAHPVPLGQPLTGHSSFVYSVAFSPDGLTLASGSADETIRLWNVTDPAKAAPLGPALTGHTNHVLAVAFSPDGHILASGSSDETIRLWRIG